MTSTPSRIVALAVAFAPTMAVAQPTGPATQAAERWYATDLSLGCLASNGRTVACGPGNLLRLRIFYGDASGGPGQPDAVALLNYRQDAEQGNRIATAAAYFRQDGNGWRFVRMLPGMEGVELAPGSQVRFAGGRVMLTMLVMKPTDPRCCPTGRKSVALPLR